MNNTNLSFHAGKDVLKHKKFMHLGFTLAEMMVVMLIMSIILAAMAPVMTTRARKMEEDRLSSTIWQWADNDTDIYFGYNPDELDVSNTQKVMIGQNTALGTDLARLVLNNSDDLPDYIRFNKDATTYGRLYMNDTSLTLGSGQGSGGGAQSTSIGIGALAENTGASNTALGYNALNANTTGDSNIAIGRASMPLNTTGSSNIAIGKDSIFKNTTGSENTAVGFQSMYEKYNASAVQNGNTTLGFKSLHESETSYNTALGHRSMETDYSDNGYNTAVGASSLNYNVGDYNTALGSQSLFDARGDYNTAVGYGSMKVTDSDSGSVSGDYNTAVGAESLTGGRSGWEGGVNGSWAGGKVEGSNNVAIGYQALRDSYTGDSNTAVGALALSSSRTGYDNTAVGYSSMVNLDEGYDNTAVGFYSLYNVTYGDNNVAIGKSAAYRLLSGSENVAIGGEYLLNGTRYGTLGSVTTGDHNIAIGAGALTGVYGDDNIGIGSMSCENVRSGSNFICLGHHSGPSSSSPFINSYIGEHIYLGSTSRFNGGDAVLEVHNIDDTMTSSGAPYGGMNGSGVVINGTLLVNGPIMSRFVHTGNSEVNELGILEVTDGGTGQRVMPTNTSFGDFLHRHPLYDYSMDKSWRSDRRLKYVGKEFTSGLDKIRQLKVFNYTFKKDDKKTPHVGVIAQDLQKVFPDAVKKGADGFLQIRFEDMFYAVINAIKELDSRVTALEKENAELKKMLKQVQHDTTLQEARLKSLESKLK